MARYNLTQNQAKILTSWLYEPSGYLDATVRMTGGQGQTARQALTADPSLDLVNWIYGGGLFEDVDSAHQCAMVWWIVKNDNVNITPPTRPSQSPEWVAILNGWLSSIQGAFQRVGQQQRDGSTVILTRVDGTTETMGAGTHLLFQSQVISNVLGVLA